MSKSTFGWKRAGFAGIAAALVAGGTLVGAGAATAATEGLTASSAPTVTRATAAAAAGDLVYTFNNDFTTGATVTVTIAGNDCSTTAGIAKAIGFGATSPTATVANVAPGITAVPSFTATRGSTGSCATYVDDKITYAVNAAATVPSAEQFTLTLTNVTYKVGSNADLGNVSVNAVGTGSLPNGGPAVNAVVGGVTFAYDGFNAVNPSTTGVSLGTATIAESAKGAYFTSTAPQPVTLTLSSGIFTDGVVPTITTEGAGHTVVTPAAPTAGSLATYTFAVTTTTTNTSAAVIKVSGLQANAPTTAVQVTIDSSVPADATAVRALNVLNFATAATRMGGQNRYETAAAAFVRANDYSSNGTAVLSGGEAFPDALSASYLAGQLQTGTLLTEAAQLSSATKNALINEGVRTVYITGGTGAVSQAAEDQVAAIHQYGDQYSAFIQVVRVAGNDRYLTNAAVNQNRGASSPTVLLAAAGSLPWDAVALGPIAYGTNSTEGKALILTNGSDLSNGELGQIDALNATRVVIAGGTGSVSTAVENQLKAQGLSVSRVDGANRYATAANIALWATGDFTKKINGDTVTDTYLTTGLNFTDAVNITNGSELPWDSLSGGPAAGTANQVVVLASGTGSLSTELAAYLGLAPKTAASVATITALGGTGVTPNSLMKLAALAVQK